MPVTMIALLFLGQITGKVVSITDGDTLIVRESPTKSVTVRLVHIDAPEKGQAFGTRARQALDEMTYGRDAEVVGISKDRYGRTLGEVFVELDFRTLDSKPDSNLPAIRRSTSRLDFCVTQSVFTKRPSPSMVMGADASSKSQGRPDDSSTLTS